MTLVYNDFPRKQKLGSRIRCLSDVLFTRNVVCSYFKRERKNMNGSSITFTKDLIKDNDGNDFKIYSGF